MIHPREKIVRTGTVVLGGVVLLTALYLTSLHSYLLFHTLIELFTIIVAAGVFVIAWNARAYLNNNYLLFVGIASIFIAIIDVVHVVAYEGLGVFRDTTGNLATQLWIAARGLQSLSFLVAPVFLGRRLRVRLQMVAFGAITTLIFAAIFHWHVFPDAFIEGIGLTTFKKTAEYVISLVFLGAAAALYSRRDAFDTTVWELLTLSLALTIASELTFTSYVSAYGDLNLVGHFLRLFAFYALYKAVIETGLVKPFDLLLRDLKQSEDRLRDYATTLEARNQALRESERLLREQADMLQNRNRELDAYARTVAHDLKSPLAVIIANSEVLTASPSLPPERATTLLGRISDTALAMNRIIEALLLLSEVRKADVPVQPLDMAMIVDRVQDRLSHMIHVRHADIAALDQWPTAFGYAPWVEEVWANYLTNALKYGGDPPHIQLGASTQSDGTVRFWIRDEGPGVPPEARARLFVPFNQLGGRHPDTHGLGLSIVLQIVEKLGGQVGVESEPGHGSLFYFTLPTAPAPHPAPVPA